MATIGEAFIEVHADTKPFDRELDADLEQVAKRSEKSLDRAGKDFGDKITDSMGTRIRKRGRDIGRSIERATQNVVVRVRSTIRFDRLRSSIQRFFRRDVGDGITEEVGKALDRAGRRGGPLSRLSEGIADAIGAGFNVSGRSPLIGILLPALAALVGVIVAAVQAVNALVAVLFIVPGLIASIALQVGVVAIAFQGMGSAIQGAFAAKNAKELRLALKQLTPSARTFVKELLPLRSLFREIARTVQEKFFSQLTGVITAIRKSLGPSLIKGFGAVAEAAGTFFRQFGLLLASPGFKNFFNKLIPATVRWLDKFGDSLFGKRGFVTALINMATELMPFMTVFGDIIIRNLDRLSGLIFQLGTNPGTAQWLDDMAVTLQLVFDLLFKVGEFLFVFFKALNDAGAAGTIELLMAALSELMFVISSPVGQKAMEGLVHFGEIGIMAFTGLIIVILGVFAALEVLSEWFRVTGGPFILDVLRALGQAAVDMATFIGVWIERIIGGIGWFFRNLDDYIASSARKWVANVKAMADAIIKWVQGLRAVPGQILAIFANFGSILINAGRALINGLIEGVRQKIGELRNMLGGVAGLIGGFFGNSPAIYGPLKGRGWMTYRGRNIMAALADGIRMEIPILREATTMAASNINFGPKSIQVNFQGAVPTKDEANSTGRAVGRSAANLLAARNTRLIVRTL